MATRDPRESNPTEPHPGPSDGLAPQHARTPDRSKVLRAIVYLAIVLAIVAVGWALVTGSDRDLYSSAMAHSSAVITRVGMPKLAAG